MVHFFHVLKLLLQLLLDGLLLMPLSHNDLGLVSIRAHLPLQIVKAIEGLGGVHWGLIIRAALFF